MGRINAGIIRIPILSNLTGSSPNDKRAISPRIIDGELRILDTDLAARLGFAEPAQIRKLIKRHEVSLVQMGVISTVEITSGVKGGRPGVAYCLNRKQAIFVAAKSETVTATDITIEIIERFDAYERGEITAKAVHFDPTRLIELSLGAFPNLSPVARQTFIAKTAEIALGFPILPLPQVEEHYASASEVAQELGVTANRVGRIANQHNLKRPEYGVVVMDKSRHSSKQVEAFRYNRAGIEAIKTHLLH